jgi:hypothetical protein
VENKRFEDWTHVDCNDCARYWDSSCDGVQAVQKPCNSFLASRKVQIPAQIKGLQKSVKRLRNFALLVSLVFILHLLTHILGG